MNSIKKIVRIAGFLYLFVAICSVFSMMYLPFKIVVPGIIGELLFTFWLLFKSVMIYP